MNESVHELSNVYSIVLSILEMTDKSEPLHITEWSEVNKVIRDYELRHNLQFSVVMTEKGFSKDATG